ncbi:conserved hypothetical protein [Desulfamplus magnetovallimortis]|uniref:Addiction module toxin RelE n=1 Tax=Desulfamplus magnetovallimortis TaxID=1246637 RepID=A0A1W1HFH0_9BACT|nr:type II toxin-antitoxin system RelE/ParE family toxin [Desulfamplus magnetovallimortis]SLM31148.1 conserved hypothetical protein [Desulfamplus magnetovallimortis]
MEWNIIIHENFETEIQDFSRKVKTEFFASVQMLKLYGPQLGRPHVDTLEGSKYSNMKELRFNADNGVWRVAFAFDPKRQAILLVAGDKSGVKQNRFYKKLIKAADTRFFEWLNQPGED